ncbi:glycosyltransferase family 39 protein [Rhizophagus clarus]|uniref:Glycosyltransferase family 39 protein n=1 Tax=Rhizophagus clarus TaxID=94130 RepID=A0A8H3KX74_9GLOM|nr:glycosyltransferase family 39 protein [Rhizophagus clarus]
MVKYVVREWAELISDPISLEIKDQRVFEHADLPVVSDKLSVTLRLKIRSHTSGLATILQKGTGKTVRTPGLWLSANKSTLNPRFSGNWRDSVGMDISDGLSLNKWYHIAYTLSEPEKRLDLYKDGDWVGFYGINDVKTQKIVFNEGPLHIGRAFSYNGFDGEISNVRYFNWRLSPEEVKEDFFNVFQKKPIVHGSKVTLVHVSTRKYLSTKGIKYDLGLNNRQHMVIGNEQEIDLKNDVWTIIGAKGTGVNKGGPVSLDTIVVFKHQATGYNLHSHDMSHEKFTPISRHQQGLRYCKNWLSSLLCYILLILVTLCGIINTDDEWRIRRFDDDSGHLMSGDIISLFHVNTNKPLYSHSILLGDGSQEVSCHGDGSETNNKWRIELIN